MPRDTKRRDQETAAEATLSRKHGLARPVLFHPAPEDSGGNAEESDGDAEDPRQRRLIPIAGSRRRDPDDLGEWKLEDAEGVDLSDGEMHREGGGWHQPPGETGTSDSVITVEKGHDGVLAQQGCFALRR